MPDITWHDLDSLDERTWPPENAQCLVRGPNGSAFIGYFHCDHVFDGQNPAFRSDPRFTASREDRFRGRSGVAYAVIRSL